MLSALSGISSGIKRNDGSIVQGTPLLGKIYNRVPEQYREGFSEFMRNNRKYMIGGQAITNVPLPEGGSVQFGDTGSAAGFTEYLKTLNTPNGTGTQMPIGGTPLPDVRDRMRPTPNLQGAALVEQIQMRMQQRDVKTPAFMKYAQDVFDTQGYPTQSLQYYQNQLNGPSLGKVGAIGTKGAALGPNNPVMLPGGGSISQGEYFANYGGSDVGPNINTTPITNTGIGSLTQNPINTTPESNIMGSMTSSPYLNNNQDLDQYLNSYVENLINRRMRDIFGGIMSIFQ